MNVLSALRAPTSLRFWSRLPLVGCFAATALASACSSDGAAPGAGVEDEALTVHEAIAGGTYVIKSGGLALDGGFGHWNQVPAVQLYAAASPGSNPYQEWTLGGAGTLLNVGMGNRYLVDEGNGTAAETTAADDFTIATSGSGFTITDARTGKLLTNDNGVLALAAASGSANQVWTIETTSGGAPPAPPSTDAGSGGGGGGSGTAAPGTYVLESGTLAIDGGFGHYNDLPAVRFYATAAIGSNPYQEWTLSASGTLLNVGMGTDYLVDRGDGTASETTTADTWIVTASGKGYTFEDERTGKYLTNASGVLSLAASSGAANQVFTLVPIGGVTTTPDAGAPDSGSAPDAGPPTPPPGNLAQALLANLAFGIWIPRGNQQNLTYQGTRLYESPAFFGYLAAMGVTHVAFSYPYTPCGGSCGDLSFIGTPSTGDGYFTSMIAAGKLAQAAGLTVAYRLTDNLTPGSSDFGATLDAWETSAGKAVASSGLSPARTLIVPWGEMAGSTNAQCNPLAAHGNQVLRAVLPQSSGWVLGVSGAYWASSTVFNGDSSGQSRALVTLPSGAVDDQVVYVFDDYPFYDQGLAPSSASFAENAGKWQASHGGAAVLQLEIGDWHGQAQYDMNPGNPGAWAGSYLPLAQGAGKYAPVLWDLSSSDASLNMATLANGSEATLSSAGVSALTAANAYLREQSYFKTSGR